jgi:hypothetical protein
MRVSDSRGVLFVHVPKNGGSSIDRMFDDEIPDSRRVAGSSRHAGYAALLRAEPGLADLWSFGFVRNPWARLVSWWSMYSTFFARVDIGHPPALRKLKEFPAVWLPAEPYRHDFGRFVLEGTEKVPKFGTPQLKSLSARGRRVDFVGRLEQFDQDLAVIRDRLGLPPLDAAPHENRSRHSGYREYYDDRTRDQVAKVFARDIEAFGYEF